MTEPTAQQLAHYTKADLIAKLLHRQAMYDAAIKQRDALAVSGNELQAKLADLNKALADETRRHNEDIISLTAEIANHRNGAAATARAYQAALNAVLGEIEYKGRKSIYEGPDGGRIEVTTRMGSTAWGLAK